MARFEHSPELSLLQESTNFIDGLSILLLYYWAYGGPDIDGRQCARLLGGPVTRLRDFLLGESQPLAGPRFGRLLWELRAELGRAALPVCQWVMRDLFTRLPECEFSL